MVVSSIVVTSTSLEIPVQRDDIGNYSKTHAIPIEPIYVEAKSKLSMHTVSVTLVFSSLPVLSKCCLSHARLVQFDPIYTDTINFYIVIFETGKD